MECSEAVARRLLDLYRAIDPYGHRDDVDEDENEFAIEQVMGDCSPLLDGIEGMLEELA